MLINMLAKVIQHGHRHQLAGFQQTDKQYWSGISFYECMKQGTQGPQYLSRFIQPQNVSWIPTIKMYVYVYVCIIGQN